MKRMVAMLVVILAGGAALAVTPMIDKDTQEMSVAGSLDNDAQLGGTLGWRYGYFVANGIELGGRASGSFRGNDQKALGAGVFGEFNFITRGALVPYLGAGANVAWQDWSDDSVTFMEFTAGGGARYFFVNYAAVSIGLELLTATRDVYNRGEDRADWRMVIGTSWYF